MLVSVVRSAVCVKCCFSNAGHQFAAVHGNVIQVYSSVTYDVLVNLKGHNNRVRAVAWTDNDAQLISCGADGAVYEWQIASSRRVSENVIKQCQYNGVAVTKDMRSIVAVGSDSIKEISDSQVFYMGGPKSNTTNLSRRRSTYRPRGPLHGAHPIRPLSRQGLDHIKLTCNKPV